MMISVGFTEASLREDAEALANKLHVLIDHHHLPRLSLTPERLVLLVKGYLPLFADFHSAALRRRQAAGKSQGLIKACRPEPGLRIVDATAGWGRDASLLASFGATVVMIERHPVMAVLLEDALQRLNPITDPLATRLSLVATDTLSYLQSLTPEAYPDIIYMDPMHPERQKSALVKKDMQVLQQFIGADLDALDLLQQAMSYARQKVIIKWPQHLAPLLAPSYQIEGKTVRFDCYMVKRS